MIVVLECDEIMQSYANSICIYAVRAWATHRYFALRACQIIIIKDLGTCLHFLTQYWLIFHACYLFFAAYCPVPESQPPPTAFERFFFASSTIIVNNFSTQFTLSGSNIEFVVWYSYQALNSSYQLIWRIHSLAIGGWRFIVHQQQPLLFGGSFGYCILT